MKKKIVVLGIALMSVAFCACHSNKPVVESDFIEYELPCGDYDRDTDEYFTGLGTAETANEQNARKGALEAAKEEVRAKIGGLVKGLSTDYSKYMRGSAASTVVSSIVEGELVTVIERNLNDAYKTCERMGRTSSGAYKSYIAIKVSKADLVKDMSDALSNDEKLRMEFDRERFRQFAREYMEGLNKQK